MSKVLAIARTSWREVIRQPAIWIVTGVTLLMIVLFRYFTLFGFGEERSMIREMGLASMTLAGLLVAVLGASTVLAEEHEKRTLLTLLSKPVGRGQLVAGKFVGIALAVLLVFVPLMLAYVGAVCWSEMAAAGPDDPPVGQRIATFFFGGTAWDLTKASLLAYAGVMVLASVSIAISTRLPMIVNIILTIGVFALGHQAESILALLYPKLADGTPDFAAVEGLGFLQGVVEYPLIAIGKFFYGLIPGIEAFNAGEALALNQSVSGAYVTVAFGYAALYVAFALLVALALFRRREIA